MRFVVAFAKRRCSFGHFELSGDFWFKRLCRCGCEEQSQTIGSATLFSCFCVLLRTSRSKAVTTLSIQFHRNLQSLSSFAVETLFPCNHGDLKHKPAACNLQRYALSSPPSFLQFHLIGALQQRMRISPCFSQHNATLAQKIAKYFFILLSLRC